MTKPSERWIENFRRVVQECRAETGMPFYIFLELLGKKYDIVDDYTLAKAVRDEYRGTLIEDIKRATTN